MTKLRRRIVRSPVQYLPMSRAVDGIPERALQGSAMVIIAGRLLVDNPSYGWQMSNIQPVGSDASLAGQPPGNLRG